MKIRSLPFGYCIRDGKICVDERNSSTVRMIFEGYIQNASYQKLADTLERQGTPYIPEKHWNKNIVARILKDRHYIGDEEYPPIIARDVFQRAEAANTRSCDSPEHTRLMKKMRALVCCPMCGGAMSRNFRANWQCPNCTDTSVKVTDEVLERSTAELLKQSGRTASHIIETRYDSDGDPYDWYVLQTTLTVTPLSTIISNTLSPGEQTDRYNVYQQTLGNRQAFGNPFDFPWLGYVSSGYGWRVHPISGEKNLHRGVDIAVAQGTPVAAIHDGRVVSAGDAGSYGLCVVIEDEKGYQSRYAHCSSLSVSVGQEVKRGDVIAAVGSTGNSTGPHLHLEIMLDGEYLNPYYFVDTGYDGTTSGAIPGTPGGVEIPAYPGEPVTDETYAAMLEEAQKYLGFPYVWGGSSPSTSFDCSGFVSWVINHSGWNVGRLGAQGLYNICTPVSMANAQPGDLIFFWHTYDAPNPNGVTHVGIYVGNGQMIHCGNPISYANINSNYWQQHYYGMGRLP